MHAPLSPIISVSNLSKTYASGFQALKNINLDIRRGEIFALLGPNGAGKTTLINAIAGIQRTRGGRIVFEGRDITALPPHRFCEAGIAIVPEGRRLFTGMSVLENLEIGSYLPSARTHRAQSLEAALALFPVLKAKLASPAGELSGGQQQMVAISRALMARPKLLLLDEPSFGLAPILVQEIFRILRVINQEEHMAMLVVEQNARLALDLVGQVFLLETGRVVASGPPQQIAADESVRRAYLGQ